MRLLLVPFLLALPLLAQPARYHFGDDPSWADPKFDESAWPVVEKGTFPAPPKQGDGFVWVRHRMSPPLGDAALWLRMIGSECRPNLHEELRVDNRLIGSNGQLPPDPQIGCKVFEQVFDLPAGDLIGGAAVREVIVARRIWVPPSLRVGAVALPQIEIGSRDAIRLAALRESDRSLRGTLLQSIVALAQCLAGLGLFIAWRGTRATADIFWFSLNLAFWGAVRLVAYLTAFVWPELSFAHYWIGITGLVALYNLTLWGFTWEILNVPKRWPLYLLAGGQFMFFLGMSVDFAVAKYTVWLDYGTVYLWFARLDFASALIALALAVWLWPRSLEQRWIVGTLLLFRFILALTQLHWLSYEMSVFGFTLDILSSFQTVLLFAMARVLYRRIWRTWTEQQVLGAEFEAAREMQEALVQRLPDTPRFSIESAYRPASQVGGDFYRIFPAEDGAVLVVVGDVSGKGLKAAMTVSAIAGALDNEFSRDPAEVLAHLNRALLQHKRGGFVTCCAALLQPSGEILIANAGHLAPYADGREVEVAAGLPLGVVEDVAYEVTTATGNRFTLISDGVLEAENSKRELFGFERTREASSRSAAEIANAAQAWGQNDDITVLTVRRVHV